MHNSQQQMHWELEVPPTCPDTKDCSAGQVLKALCGTGRDETGVSAGSGGTDDSLHFRK